MAKVKFVLCLLLVALLLWAVAASVRYAHQHGWVDWSDWSMNAIPHR